MFISIFLSIYTCACVFEYEQEKDGREGDGGSYRLWPRSKTEDDRDDGGNV